MGSFRAIIISLCFLNQFYGGFGQSSLIPLTGANDRTGIRNNVHDRTYPQPAAYREVDKYSMISCKENAINYDCLFKDVHIEEFETIPTEYFGDYGRSHATDVKSLAFVSSTIRRLSRGLLETFPSTTLLNLQGLQVRQIDPDAFSYGRQLEQLYLNSNGLSELENGVFNGLTSLQVIILNRNLLSHLPLGLFSYNPWLISVSITNNALTRIPDSIFINNPHLESVNVSSNSIEYFDLSLLAVAYEIDVSYNKLAEVKLPARLGRLFASHNHIERIVPNGKNRDLKELYLSNNKLTNIAWASLYPELEELDLAYNEIEDVKNGYLPTKKLKKLLLNNNRLFSFDLTNPVPGHLRVLDLSHNQLTFIEKNKLLLASQHQLYLHNNAIVTLKLSANNSLQNVSLSNNEWDCANLRTQVAVIQPSAILDYDVPPCKQGYIMESNLCCKEAAMPYHDRLLHQIHLNSEYERAIRIQCEDEPPIFDLDKLYEALLNISSVSPEELKAEVRDLKANVDKFSAQKSSVQQELYDVKQMLSNKLPRYGGIHEGFDTARMLADKLISRLEDRKRLRESKTIEGREEAKMKESERDQQKSLIDSLEATLLNKKAINNQIKLDTAKLQSEVNKLKSRLNANAASRRIYA